MVRARKSKGFNDLPPQKIYGGEREIETNNYQQTSLLNKLARAFYVDYRVEKLNESVNPYQNPHFVLKNDFPLSPVFLGYLQAKPKEPDNLNFMNHQHTPQLPLSYPFKYPEPVPPRTLFMNFG